MSLRFEPSIEESLILTLFDVANYMTKNSELMALEGGLTVQQWLVLLQIAGDPCFPQPVEPRRADHSGVLASEIANARGVSRPNISALISVLLRKGLVRHIEDPEDRRRKYLSVTDEGLRALERIEPMRRSVNSSLFAECSDDEMKTVLGFLQRNLVKLWHLEDAEDA
jgi:DNA-binding MarR family transcriptional regulator